MGIDNPQEDIVMYMKREKKLSDEDIKEVQMVISMMNEAVILNNMLERI